MFRFFRATASKKDVFKKVNAENSSTCSKSLYTASVKASDAASDASEAAMSMKMKPITCEGVMPDFRGATKEHMSMYCLYAAIDTNCLYMFDFVGLQKISQIFHKDYNWTRGSIQKMQKGPIYSCDKCDALR